MTYKEIISRLGMDMKMWGGNPALCPEWKQHEWLIQARNATRYYKKELEAKRAARLQRQAA